jgi:shikimate dehydrogenase
MTPIGSTRVAAVIGSPVGHSLSPVLHNAAFGALGLDWVFVALDVSPGRAVPAVKAMRDLGLAGLSITMPHKSDAVAAVDRLTTAARELSAINCVAWDGGELIGHNTDGDGFIDALRLDLGVDPAGRRVAVLGAGGAARAVIRALAGAGAADVVVVNRTLERGQHAASLAGAVGRVGTMKDVALADMVVNATPVGMSQSLPDDLPVPADVLHDGQVVADLVYQPLVTPLLRAATACGASTLNGVGMLLHQASRAFELWTSQIPPVQVMRAALVDALLTSAQPADRSGR